METAISFFLKSIISSGILLAYYWLALRDKKFHRYNRFYLLSAMIISLVVPCIRFNWYSVNQPGRESVTQLLALIGSDNVSAGSAWHLSWAWILISPVIAVSVVLLCVLLSRIMWIFKVKRQHVTVRMDGFNLIETDLTQAPFTFLDNLFWRTSIPMDDENGKKILVHELTHIFEKHTYDKLFAQVMTCIFWMNPFYWIMEKELTLIHEFIADSRSVKEGDADSLARILLQSLNEGSYLQPSHLFFQSPIKRRLIMITNSQKSRYSSIRRIMVLPISVLIFGMFSFTVASRQTTPADYNTLTDTSKIRVPKGFEPPFSKKELDGMAKNSTGQKSLNLVFYLDGVVSSKEAIQKLPRSAIKNMRVLSVAKAKTKYSHVGKDGVVEFFTK